MYLPKIDDHDFSQGENFQYFAGYVDGQRFAMYDDGHLFINDTMYHGQFVGSAEDTSTWNDTSYEDEYDPYDDYGCSTCLELFEDESDKVLHFIEVHGYIPSGSFDGYYE